MSPECRAFSQARAASWNIMDPHTRNEVEQRGLEYIDLCVRVALYQRSKGRYFSFEHPEGAS
eukprot:1425393-Pyramimonas_sp.AAC.1